MKDGETTTGGPRDPEGADSRTEPPDDRAAARRDPVAPVRAALRRALKVLLGAGRAFAADGCFNHTAAISYYALLSVVPFVTLLAWVLGLMLGSSEQGARAAIEGLERLAPTLGPQVVGSARQLLEASTTIGLASLAASLYLSSWVFFSVQTAVNQIFHQPRDYHGWRGIAKATAWETIRPLLLFFGATLMLVLSFLLDNIAAILRSAAPDMAQELVAYFGSLPLVGFGISFLLSALVFAVIVQMLTARILRWSTLLPAAATGALGWEIAKRLFAAYLGYLSEALSFQGSAVGVVLFLLWIYYAAAVLLFSIEVAAVLDRSA